MFHSILDWWYTSQPKPRRSRAREPYIIQHIIDRGHDTRDDLGCAIGTSTEHSLPKLKLATELIAGLIRESNPDEFHTQRVKQPLPPSLSLPPSPSMLRNDAWRFSKDVG